MLLALEGVDESWSTEGQEKIGLGLRGLPHRVQAGILELNETLAHLEQLAHVRLARLEESLQVSHLGLELFGQPVRARRADWPHSISPWPP